MTRWCRKRSFPTGGASGDHQGGAPGRFLNCRTHGGKAPARTDDGGRVPFGPEPGSIPETYAAPESSEWHAPRGGSVPVAPVTSIQLEAPDNLLEALRGASIVDEHRALMGTIIEKV